MVVAYSDPIQATIPGRAGRNDCGELTGPQRTHELVGEHEEDELEHGEVEQDDGDADGFGRDQVVGE